MNNKNGGEILHNNCPHSVTHVAAECIYCANSFSATLLPPRHQHFSAFIVIMIEYDTRS